MLRDARELADEINILANFELTQLRHTVRRRNVNFDYEARDDLIEDRSLKYKAEFIFSHCRERERDKAINTLNPDDYLDSIISDRKSKEEQARVTAESQLEFERINLEKVKLEIELGKINLERAKLESQRDSNELQRTNPETKQTSIENFILSVRTLTLPIPKKQEGWNLFSLL
ncbi:hypothetical protein TNCV_3067061 [Trichonephila clavipes]|nr:hypothetical protein TNCV_3067061 [Trichonephila clavipes]